MMPCRDSLPSVGKYSAVRSRPLPIADSISARDDDRKKSVEAQVARWLRVHAPQKITHVSDHLSEMRLQQPMAPVE